MSRKFFLNKQGGTQVSAATSAERAVAAPAAPAPHVAAAVPGAAPSPTPASAPAGARARAGAGKKRWHPTWRMARRIPLVLFAGLLVGVNVYVLNAKVVLHDAFPMPFGVGLAVVMSGSMEPALAVDDVAVVRPLDGAPALGDVVVYERDSDLVIHRVVAVDTQAGTITTQGDANNAADAPVALDAVKGRMVARIPGVGALVRTLQDPAVVGAVLLAAFVLVELSIRRGIKAGEGVAITEAELEQLRGEVSRLRAVQVKAAPVAEIVTCEAVEPDAPARGKRWRLLRSGERHE